MNQSLRNFILLASACLVTAHSQAAEIKLAKTPDTGSPLSGITVEGDILPGDFVKFKALILATRGANAVYLASRGGDFSEALRMGRLIRALSLEVWAPMYPEMQWVALTDAQNNTCASACFFLYAAGVQRFGKVVGVHRPFLSKDDYRSMGLDEAAQAHLWIKDKTAEYLREMDVPEKYLSLVMSADSGGVVWLSREDITRDFDGFIDQYDEWFRAHCPSLTQAQIAAEEQVRKKAVRGETLTPAERAIRTEVEQVIASNVECTSKKLTEIQERKRSEMLETLLGKK